MTNIKVEVGPNDFQKDQMLRQKMSPLKNLLVTLLTESICEEALLLDLLV